MKRKELLPTRSFRRAFAVGWGGLSLTMALMLSVPSRAQAAPCDDLGGTIVGLECQVDSNVARSGAFNLPQSLHLLPGGVITTTGLTLNIIGNFLMDTGSAIIGDTSGNGTGATIVVNATADVILIGNGTSGAIISSNNGTCTSTGAAGAITLTADSENNLDGNVDIQPGAKVTANSFKCPAGAIVINGVNINQDGLVQSKSELSGTGGTQRPGGGPISLNATCGLIVSDTGIVSSEGLDPGADLVHLEGGCNVQVFGLVESTGAGHSVPNSPKNHCNNSNRPDKPTNSTACVEIWAGDSLEINSTAPHNGQVNADVTQKGGTNGLGWIDIFVRGPLVIVGDTTTAPYAVHTNAAPDVTNAHGGQITLKSTTSTVTMTGLAVQANALGSGGRGGLVTIEGNKDVTLNTSSTEARGSNGGGTPAGGAIAVRSFNGQLTGTAPGELDAFGGNPANGTVKLTSCVGTLATTYTGVVTGTRTDANGVCGGAPTVATYVVLKPCLCLLPKITVTKECVCSSPSGQPPFTINIAGTVCNAGAVLLNNVTLSDNPVATFSLPPLPVATLAPTACFDYTGTLNAQVPLGVSTDTITATGSPSVGSPVIDTATASCACDILPPGNCPEDPKAKLTSTVDPKGPHAGLPNFLTVQEAVDAANSGAVIGMFGSTVENVVIDDAKKLTITQCTVAKIFAADDTLPAVTISSSKKILIIGPDTFGGSIGWDVQTNGHELRGVRAAQAGDVGINVAGNKNKVSWNSIRDSAEGIRVEGDNNTLRGGTIENNAGNGAELTSTANGNTFQGATIRNNFGDGLVVDGALNKIKSNKATSNVGNEFDIGPGNTDGGSNKANNVKCKFDSSGKICN